MLKTVSSITNAIGALNFKGTWDANTNSPALTSSVGTKGDYYVVGTAGATNLNGISNWGVGDLATFNGSVWQRVEGGADLNGVNLSVSGTSTLSNLTASTALALNASKEIVSVTNTGTGDNVLATSPTLVTPVLGAATATSINKVALTAPATGSTLTIADGKTLTANHSLTLAGTDATTMTFPTTSATIARTDAGQIFSGDQSIGGTLWVQDTNNLQFGYTALRATINGSDTFTFTPRSGYGAQFNAEVAVAGKIQPTTDNTFSCGAAANRWTEVFAATALINTSDARDKTEVRSLNDAEISASKSLAKEIGAFKFLSAVSLKGDAAREHIGMTVQRAIEIMQSHNLDAFGYGFICFDKWDDKYVDVEVPEEYIDENGETQTRPVKTGEKKLVLVAGEKYGFRTDQLLMFIARGFEARLTALEGA